MPYALCPIVPHVTEKDYISFFQFTAIELEKLNILQK